MGMFDTLKCHYPLPVPGFEANDFQTKDTPAQFCDQYEIRADGTLWHLAYDIKDREGGGWENINERWEPVPFVGEIRFYDIAGPEKWIEFSAYFKDGALQHINQLPSRW